jgi:predicted PurR-regulated permease PerM
MMARESVVHSSASEGRVPRNQPRSGPELAVFGLVFAAALFLAWRAANGLFLIFTGLLFAVFLDACTRALGRFWAASRPWRLATASIALALLVCGGIGAGGYTLARQADELATTVQDQLRLVRGELSKRGLLASGQTGGERANEPATATVSDDASQRSNSFVGQLGQSLLPDPGAFVRSAASAFGALLGGLGNLVVIVFLGLYVAIDPQLYRRGALLVVSRGERDRIGAVLDEVAGSLRRWMVGQLVSMAIIAVMSFVGLLLIGMPGATVLALQVGAFAFIPYIGAFVGGAVIVLAALAQGGTMALWAFGVYFVVQFAESYVIAPLVQRRTTHLPPALTIAALVVFGSLFGLWGLALAAPIVASLRVMTLRLWVERTLGDRVRSEIA